MCGPHGASRVTHRNITAHLMNAMWNTARGIMADPTKLPEVGLIGRYLVEALAEYEGLAAG